MGKVVRQGVDGRLHWGAGEVGQLDSKLEADTKVGCAGAGVRQEYVTCNLRSAWDILVVLVGSCTCLTFTRSRRSCPPRRRCSILHMQMHMNCILLSVLAPLLCPGAQGGDVRPKGGAGGRCRGGCCGGGGAPGGGGGQPGGDEDRHGRRPAGGAGAGMEGVEWGRWGAGGTGLQAGAGKAEVGASLAAMKADMDAGLQVGGGGVGMRGRKGCG